jgi:DNA/RNA-binding domain of Phe-tRNA-synthetase-like protein
MTGTATMPDLQAFLANAKVTPDVFELRPDYRAYLVAAEGIPPGPSDEMTEDLLQNAEATAKDRLSKDAVTDIPHIAAWREAYKAFGAKPNKYRNSAEALSRRVEGGLPRVNRLTDIYNSISVKYCIPLGGEDLDKYQGHPMLTRASGKEKFEVKVRGELVEEAIEAGEVVWCDEVGVTCRRWNWRQGPRTALTDETTRVLFILDALEPLDEQTLEAAAKELEEHLKRLSEDVKVVTRLIRRAG